MSEKYMPVEWKDLYKAWLSESPKNVKGTINESAAYYRSWALKKIYGRFEFEGFNKSWDMDYMLDAIFIDGGVCFTDTDMGLLPLKAGLSGINVFNHPTTCIIANAILGSFERTIDTDCIYVKLQYNYMGVLEMITRYATLLAECDSALSVNLMNSKVAFIAEVKDNKQAATMKKMYDMISQGEPAVFYNNSDGDSSYSLMNVKQNYVADLIMSTKRSIINEFLTEIGIGNYNMGKTSRLNVEEVHGNDEEIENAIDHWLVNLTEGFDAVNRMFGTNLSIRKKVYDNGLYTGELNSTIPGNTTEPSPAGGNE